jgi:phosphatidylserine/phosphatidylglycerophosphate/cardiolipin synthase-like enzyme
MTAYFLDDPAAPHYAGCAVTPLLDGAAYAGALAVALARVGTGAPGQVVLLAGWWLGLAGGVPRLVQGPVRRRLGLADAVLADAPPYCLDPWPDGATPFADPPDQATALLPLLQAKARAGVDVRVLGWAAPGSTHDRLARLVGAGTVLAVNQLTMRSVAALRADPAVGAKAVLNTVGHAVGSCHSKVALVCDGEHTVAFSGGIDLDLSRWARPAHAGADSWHDVAVQVEGPAAQAVYDHFRELWAENLARPAVPYRLAGRPVPSRLSGTPALPERKLPVAPVPGRHRVQALQTLPAARFRRLRIGPRSRALAGAPAGRFTYSGAIRAAIRAARHYVYAEDQMLWSTDVMGWLNAALRARPELRVLLLMPGRDDPSDPPMPHAAFRGHALGGRLLAGLDPGQRSRVAVFRRDGVYVHAKTVLVDDAWAVIGSGNLAQRSLYTDIEHGYAFADDGDLVRSYRARLWAHHFRHGAPADFAPLPAGLHAWRPDWGTPGAAPPRPAWLHPVELPAGPVPYPRRHRWLNASFLDPDSRRPWSGLSAVDSDRPGGVE